MTENYIDVFLNTVLPGLRVAVIGDMTREIENQRRGVTGVLDTLNSLAQDNAASSEETSDLKNDIDELQEDVKRFTV